MVSVMVKASGISTPPKKPCSARSTIICCRLLRERAGDRHHQEQHGVHQQIAAQREHRRQEAGERDHHDLRHQIGGRDPAAIVDAGADRALDVGQRRVGDLDVQHRDEGADDGADDREPDLAASAFAARCAAVMSVAMLAQRCAQALAASRVSIVGSTDMPGRSTPGRARRRGRSTIFTGMRWTILVKLPVALSGGSSANSWPLAGAMLSTTPCTIVTGEGVDLDLHRLARPHVGELCLLVVRHDVDRVQRHDRHQLRAGLHVLADAQRPGADRAVLGCDDRRIAEVQPRLLLHRVCMLQAPTCASASAVRSTATCWRALAQRRLGTLQIGRPLQQQRLGLLRLLHAARAGMREVAVALLVLRGEARRRLGRGKLRRGPVDHRLLQLELRARCWRPCARRPADRHAA